MPGTGQYAPGRTTKPPINTPPASVVKDNGAAQRTTLVGNAGRSTGQGGPTAEELAAYAQASIPPANILNNYRSVSYNFTLATMTKSQLNNPSTFDPSKPSFIIASNKGKRPGSMSPSANPNETIQTPPTTAASSKDTTALNEAAGFNPYYNVSDNAPPADKAATEKQNNAQTAEKVNDLISSFNRISPGRFDMYIDNVDIKSIFKFTGASGTSLPTEIHFDVVEPYSINGFFEALQVGSLGAGYTDYISGNYALIMEFYGYPDTGDVPDPVLISDATRVFTIKIIQAELDINERGTVYKVAAIPVSEATMKKSVATIPRSMTIRGANVYGMLQDLVKQRNEQILKADEEKSSASGNHDTYEIVFPNTDSNGNPMIDSNGKAIGGSNSIAAATYYYVTPPSKPVTDQGTAYQVSSSLKQPTDQDISRSGRTTVGHFSAGQPIESIIRAVIMDSSYIGNTLKAFYSGGDPSAFVDKNGNIKYFNIVPRVTEIPNSINPETNAPYKKYTYMVLEYPMLYTTALPGLARNVISKQLIKNRAVRTYNYIYTGMNVDVLDFKIHFDNLFFEEMPRAMGASKILPARDQAAPQKTVNPVNKQTTPSTASTGVPTPPKAETFNASSNAPGNTVNSTDQTLEPWQQVRKVMNDLIYGGSKSGMITGEITILGDPYFLSDNTNGNAVPVKSKSKNAVVNQSVRQVDILINFKNPIDINGNNNGFAQFEDDLVGFSGLFQVTEIRHEFKRGSFRQTLTIVRVPGQPQNSNEQASPLNAQYGAIKNPNDQGTTDTSQPSAPSTVVTSDGTTIPVSQAINASALINVPNTSIENYGGLGGNLNAVPGAQNSIGVLAPTKGSIFGSANAAALFGAQTALVPNAASLITTAQKVISGATSANATLAAGVAVGLNADLTQALASTNIAKAVTSGVNRVEQNVQQVLNGNPAANIANQFGINPQGITGLTGAISGALLGSLLGNGRGKTAATLLGGLAGLAASIPKNVDLQSASKQGIVINNLNADTIANLPAIPPVVPGVTYAGWIGGNPITPANLSNPLNIQNSALNSIGSSLQAGRLGSSVELANAAAGINASIESTQNLINTNVGNFSNNAASVVSRFGSNSNNSTSPLVTALLNTNNSAIPT